MSTFDEASLVFIPSGYKTSKAYSVKPSDGSGDLVFSRSNDTATRVNSAGLIEKVRTNLALQSQSFATSAVWGTVNGTVTNNAGTAPDGTNTASKIVATDSDPFVYQPLTLSGSVVVSCYVKGIGSSIGKNGSIRAGSSLTVFTITGDWQRVSLVHSAGGAQNYGLETPESAAVSDEVLLWGFQVEYGDVATDYIATTSAAVSVGPVASVPRLDYLNSSCPRLLLEPQRTNRAQYSEQFSNAFWTKDNFTISSNVAVSPDGFTNADKVVSTAANGEHVVYYFDSLNGGSGTISVFVKKAEYRYAILRSVSGGSYNITVFDFDTLTFPVETLGTGKSESYGNGWYRISVSYTLPASGSYGVQFGFSPTTGHVYTGDGTSGGFAYGFQFEEGAYATSYIPTLGSASTRASDACSKTGISSLIGQTEGTLFIDVIFETRQNFTYFAIAPDVTSAANYLGFYITTGTIGFESVVSNALQAGINLSNSATGRFKLAAAYKANDFVFYVNGVQVGTDTSGSVPTCSQVGLYQYNQNQPLKYNQVLLFKTRLTNAQLAELTTL